MYEQLFVRIISTNIYRVLYLLITMRYLKRKTKIIAVDGILKKWKGEREEKHVRERVWRVNTRRLDAEARAN